MARRKKIGELRDSEIECGYCDAIIPENAMRCPSCGKYFSAFKKMMAFSIVVVIVLAGMTYFVYSSYMSGQEGFVDPLTPIDPNNPNQPSADGRTIIFELKEADVPNTCANFKKYVEDSFYNGLIFHRVIDGFMIQGGGFETDLTQKQATYAPINLEISPNLRHIDGAVAMARMGSSSDPSDPQGHNTATSQFYICDGPQTNLDDQYAVFGQVVSGMDVVRAISAVSTTTEGGMSDVPASDVVIQSASLSTQDGKTYVTLVVDF